MTSSVYKDRMCQTKIDENIDPFKSTFADLRSKCEENKLWYKASADDGCHEVIFSGLGFHLAHEEKFHECASEKSTIVGCIVGDAAAEMYSRQKENGADTTAFIEQVNMINK